MDKAGEQGTPLSVYLVSSVCNMYVSHMHSQVVSISWYLPPPPPPAVLFSVDVTTAVVTAGETVSVNCSQTGYIRTDWSWKRNGADITSDMSERVYTQLSTRTKLGPTVPTVTVPNHQSLFLRLRYARMTDNGVYTCVTETDTQTVTVDVRPPGGTLYCVTTQFN